MFGGHEHYNVTTLSKIIMIFCGLFYDPVRIYTIQCRMVWRLMDNKLERILKVVFEA
jgi:hypothetical protein